jgi:ABC-type amino acid transport substrate-binding protein
MQRSTRLAASSLVTLAVVHAALLPAPAAASSKQEVLQRGKLVVLAFPHSLSSFMRKTGTGYDGVDHDLMRAFASRLGVEMEIRAVAEFEDLVPELRAGRGDVIASSFSITPPRREQVDFSNSYFPVLIFVVARSGSGIAGPADLTGKTGCVVAGSSQEERMNRMATARKHHVKSSGDCWVAVQNGAADFTLLDSTAVLRHIDEYPGVVRAFHLPEADNYGFAVTRGSDLRAELDAFIAESRQSGFLYHVVERYFGKQGAELFRLVK